MSDFSYVEMTSEDLEVLKSENQGGLGEMAWIFAGILVIMPCVFYFIYDSDMEDFIKYELIAIPICAFLSIFFVKGFYLLQKEISVKG